MRALVVPVALSVTLAAASSYAQAPASPQTAKPNPAAPAGQTTKPAAPQTQTPAAPPQPAPPVSQVPFQEGFKYAYINIQTIAADSADGKKATAEINALREKLQGQLNEKNKALQGSQAKLDSQGSVLSDAARQQLQTDVERQQREIQRMIEDAEQDVERLTQRLQRDFMVKLQPIIDRIAKEKKVDMIFNAGESGLVWAAPGMDLTGEVIKALDGTTASTAKPAAQTAPPATAPAAAAPTAAR